MAIGTAMTGMMVRALLLPVLYAAIKLAAGILVSGAGGAFSWMNWKQQEEDRQRTYLALCYLEQQRLEEAEY